MTTNLYDIDAALRIMDLIIADVDVETALATETPIGEAEIEECINAFFYGADEIEEGGDD